MISEDVYYDFKLGSKEFIILELNPVFNNIDFEFTSEGSPISACFLASSNAC